MICNTSNGSILLKTKATFDQGGGYGLFHTQTMHSSPGLSRLFPRFPVRNAFHAHMADTARRWEPSSQEGQGLVRQFHVVRGDAYERGARQRLSNPDLPAFQMLAAVANNGITGEMHAIWGSDTSSEIAAEAIQRAAARTLIANRSWDQWGQQVFSGKRQLQVA